MRLFPQWAYVSRCTDLRFQLKDRRSIGTDQLPVHGHGRIDLRPRGEVPGRGSPG
jgi:hypothetical protein